MENALYNLNIEKAILSSIIFNPAAHLKNIEKLDVEDFFYYFHKSLFAAIKELLKDEKPVDEEFLKEKLLQKNQYDEDDFFEVLAANTLNNIDQYIEVLKEKTQKRQLNKIINEIKNQLPSENTFEIIEKAKKHLELVEQQKIIKDNYQKINLYDAFFKAPEPLKFVLEGFEEGTIGILTGQGNVGKGFVSLLLCASIADTTNSFNYLNLVKSHGSVGFLTAEDKETAMRIRLFNLGQWLYRKYNHSTIKAIEENLDIRSLYGSGVNIYNPKDATDYKTSKWIDYITKFAENKKLVVIDTLRRFHSGDENNSSDMSEVLKVFENIASKTGASFLLIHHSNKAAYTTNEQISARGSSAIIDNARYHIAMTTLTEEKAKKLQIDEDSRHLFVMLDVPKSNYAPHIETKLLQRSGDGLLFEYKRTRYAY